MILLRPVVAGDLPFFCTQQQDPIANALAAFPARDTDAFYQHWNRILADPGVVVRTILASGSVAGNVCAFEQQGALHVGYWLGREHWGRGVATAALREFLCVVTRRPLHARVVRENRPSIRVLEKCGFQPAGEEAEEALYLLR